MQERTVTPDIRTKFHAGIIVLALCLALCGCAHPIASSEDSRENAIPFMLTAHNNIVVKSILNDRDELDLMLHTATAELTLTEEAVRASTSLRFTDSTQVEAWGGRAESRYSDGNRLRIGGFLRDELRVWENRNSGPGTDGKFGLDFFDGRIVEIDFDRGLILIHARLPQSSTDYHKLALQAEGGELFVEADCVIAGTPHRNRFLVHSGYAGGLLLDDAFVANTGLDRKVVITEQSALQDSYGNSIQVRKGLMPILVLGESRLQNVPVGFFSGAVGAQKISVIGGDILKRFNLIFDLKDKSLYLRERNAASG
ncbi:MAG: hypothetical protein E6Q88_00355 [Lysobacteraceae bacterium]|nr:MAG: hypothetical protein E6Q88_00355 [Xanthomonadaceae bacterium]